MQKGVKKINVMETVLVSFFFPVYSLAFPEVVTDLLVTNQL